MLLFIWTDAQTKVKQSLLYTPGEYRKKSGKILPIYMEYGTHYVKHAKFYVLMNILTSLHNKMPNSTPLGYLKIQYL